MGSVKMAQDIIKNHVAMGGRWCGAFNARVLGDTYLEATKGGGSLEAYQGWGAADEMINAGKIFYMYKFPHGCSSLSFSYGGSQVCNSCNRSHLNQPWWYVKVCKDGDAWCVIGLDFKNLQESDNYAFGDTKEDALEEYYKIFTKEKA